MKTAADIRQHYMESGEGAPSTVLSHTDCKRELASLDPKARRAFVSDLGGTVRVIDLDEGGHATGDFSAARIRPGA